MGTETETELLLRPMTAADLEAVKRLEDGCFSVPWSAAALEEMLKNPYDEAWVAVLSDGSVAGYANFRFLAGEGELMRLAVLPAFRGNGYARKLMERLDASATEQKAENLTLEVRAGNVAAGKLYESCGFKTEAVRRNYYTRPTEDARIMWRRRA